MLLLLVVGCVLLVVCCSLLRVCHQFRQIFSSQMFEHRFVEHCGVISDTQQSQQYCEKIKGEKEKEKEKEKERGGGGTRPDQTRPDQRERQKE